MANPSLQIGNEKWAIKEDNLLGYSTAGTRFVPQPITMTRASAGTRVNSSGLVETVELLGSEEVTNGDFATDSDWAKAPSGVTISGGSANFNSSSDTYVYQDILTATKTYKIIFSGTINSGSLYIGENGVATNIYTAGTYTNEVAYFTVASSVRFIIRKNGAGTLDATIDNISVKESTKNNLARVDYDGTASSLLVEPQRTNELTQSNQFDTTWVQSGTLTSGQDGVGGSTDAWKFENPNATSSLYQADTTSGVQTLSAYFKKNSNYGVRFFAFGSVNCSAYFDLNNGAVVLAFNSTAKIETVGDDWFRCSMTFDQTTSRCDFYVTNNASTQVLGDYTIQYAQLEEGSYPTSYIPTSGSTVTRVQDQYSKTGISNLINSEEGVLFLEASTFENGADCRITLSDGTITNRVSIEWDILANTIKGFVGSDGNLVSSATYNQTNSNKIALKYKENDCALWINGTEVDTDFSVSALSGVNQLEFSNYGGTVPFEGKVKQLQVYKTALTDPELVTLTTI